jgi:formate dehydrogenase subunit gamma
MNINVASGDVTRRTQAILDRFIGLEGPLLPILHEVQEEFGFVPQETLPVIAEALNLSRAEVHGVMTFYHDYRDHPTGRHVLKLCRAEACQAMGGDDLIDRVKKLLGIDFHQTTLDGSVTLEPVFCLGLCSCAPAAMLDGALHGRLDGQAVEALVQEARQ